ncbi:MAG TPA: protein kinase [Kofleriaceae bacterium]|nr:protein kinase [Kofleriaceae bacterium]
MAQAISRNIDLPQSSPCGPGTLIGGRYRVIELLGQGMSSLVYRARQEALDRDVALKVLHLRRSTDPVFVSRFHAEARIASAISDRHSAAIYDFGEHDGSQYLVMELVTGIPLGQELDRGAAELARVATVMGQILDGLTAIHRAGVTHADLKPDNVIISDSEHGFERVVLIDFGIARLQPRGEESVGRSITKEQLVAGTPGYIAPEVIGGETPTPAADLYAAGVILFELLTGSQPYVAENGLEVMRRHVCEPIPRPSSLRLELPAACDVVCRRALAKSPQERYATASEFRDALESALQVSALEIAAGPEANDDDTRPTWDMVPALERAPAALPFVGRRDQEQCLVELFEGTSPHAAMRLTGVAGSGRTTLVARAVELASASGPRVIMAGADPTGARSLYAPVRALLESLFALPPRMRGRRAARRHRGRAGARARVGGRGRARARTRCAGRAHRRRATRAGAVLGGRGRRTRGGRPDHAGLR